MAKQQYLWILLGLVGAAQMALVAIAWRKRNDLPGPALPSGRLAYSRNMLLGAKIGLSLSAVAACFFVTLPLPDPGFLWLLLSLAAFGAAISVWGMLAYKLERHEFSEDGLVYRTWMGDIVSVRWTDLRSVRHWLSCECFRLVTTTGKALYISTHLQGVFQFAAVALRHVPGAAIDQKAREALEATATGNPPRGDYIGV